MIRLMGQSAHFVSRSENIRMKGIISSLISRSNPEELLKNDSILQVFSFCSMQSIRNHPHRSWIGVASRRRVNSLIMLSILEERSGIRTRFIPLKSNQNGDPFQSGNTSSF